MKSLNNFIKNTVTEAANAQWITYDESSNVGCVVVHVENMQTAGFRYRMLAGPDLKSLRLPSKIYKELDSGGTGSIAFTNDDGDEYYVWVF